MPAVAILKVKKVQTTVWEIISAGGLLMLPIVICSIVAVAIVIERFWSLRRSRVLPDNLVASTWKRLNNNQISREYIQELRGTSPLGNVLAAGLMNRNGDRDQLRNAIEDAGSHAAHELERYLPALGTIAAVTPLLGLLGTVIGMIRVFTNITTLGVGNPSQLAGGISQALITTAGGLMVAIPSLMFYRFFRARVDELVVGMEKESRTFLDVLVRRPVAGNAPVASNQNVVSSEGAVSLDATQAT